jgi:vancomycin resistance protein YoaR
MSPRQILFRGIGLGIVAVCLCTGLFLGYVSWYSRTDRILPGVVVGQMPVGGLDVPRARARLAGLRVGRSPVLAGAAAGAGAGGAAGPASNGAGGGGADAVGAAGGRPAREATLRWGDRTWSINLRQIGALPDVNGALREARSLGRHGTLMRQATAFLAGMIHGYYVSADADLRTDVLTERLTEIAEELGRPAVDAVYHFESDTVTDEAVGQALDIPASITAIRRALRQGQRDIGLIVREVEPNVHRADLSHSRRHEVGRFTTPILAADPGRLQNIAIAVRKISGIALKPGQVFSFNEIVGPRDAEHGWAQANELFHGEFVRGYGGGICQVSSTLYNAVLLSGLEVKERYHHDRPLQYVEPGRDATVAWNVLDFKFRNNTEKTLLIAARIVPGAPQEIEVTVYAPDPPGPAVISLEAGDIRYFPPELEEVPDRTLTADQRQVEDEGHYGIEVKIYRVFAEDGKERRELVSHDKYQPKAGKVRIGVDNAPGNERLFAPGIR